MDKSTLIAKVASDPEDRLLLARVLDKYEQMERRGIPTATGFLSPREQQLAAVLLNTAGIRTGYAFDGGYEGAERRLLAFLPDWAEDASGELAFLRAGFRGADSTLTHRDILGSLMGLGITREKLGLLRVRLRCVASFLYQADIKRVVKWRVYAFFTALFYYVCLLAHRVLTIIITRTFSLDKPNNNQ